MSASKNFQLNGSIGVVVKALGGERAGHKYFKRVPKAGGGYTYYYTKKEWDDAVTEALKRAHKERKPDRKKEEINAALKRLKDERKGQKQEGRDEPEKNQIKERRAVKVAQPHPRSREDREKDFYDDLTDKSFSPIGEAVRKAMEAGK